MDDSAVLIGRQLSIIANVLVDAYLMVVYALFGYLAASIGNTIFGYFGYLRKVDPINAAAFAAFLAGLSAIFFRFIP